MPGLRDRLERVRSVVPLVVIDRVARSRAEKLWQLESIRQYHLDAMEFLLGETRRADEVETLARGLLEDDVRRRWMRYKRRHITRQPVRGIELLLSRDLSRPAILSFMHHARYDGMFGSIARHGVELKALAAANLIDPRGQHELIRQHFANVRVGAELVSTEHGSAGLLELLRPGAVVAMASDVPSRTEVTFLNRRVLGSSGAPRVATTSDSLVFVATSHGYGSRSHIQIHEPLDPRDYATPEDLLDEVLRIHGEAILEWPEASDKPLNNFGRIDA